MLPSRHRSCSESFEWREKEEMKKMNTTKTIKDQSSKKQGEYGFIPKAAALTAAAFFILGGISMPISFGAVSAPVVPVKNVQVPTVTVAQANAKTTVTPAPVPSGSLAANVSSPLSASTNKVNTPEVPKGWTVAASNANYAFQIKVAGENNFLFVMDLKTGKTTELVKVQPSGTTPAQISSFYDVSPDGKNVVYGVTTGTSGTIFVESNDGKSGNSRPAQQLVLGGKLQSISFGTNTLGESTVAIKVQQAGKVKITNVNLKKLATA